MDQDARLERQLRRRQTVHGEHKLGCLSSPDPCGPPHGRARQLNLMLYEHLLIQTSLARNPGQKHYIAAS